MPIAGPRQDLAAGATVQLVAPIGPSVSQSWSVQIDNMCPWPVAVNLAGQHHQLSAGVAHLYHVRSGPAAAAVTSLSPVGATSAGYLNAQWAQHPDTIPGTYPSVIGPSPQNLDLVTTGLAAMAAQLAAMAAQLAAMNQLLTDANQLLTSIDSKV